MGVNVVSYIQGINHEGPEKYWDLKMARNETI
jgi:hypothetical protein